MPLFLEGTCVSFFGSTRRYIEREKLLSVEENLLYSLSYLCEAIGRAGVVEIDLVQGRRRVVWGGGVR